MALITRLRAFQIKDESFKDITKNLPSLQFENALSDDDKKLVVLRPISHALTITHCALTTVMIDVFSRGRKALLSVLNQDKKTTDYGNHSIQERDPLIIGIIGCGRIGREVANCLLTFGQLIPSRLKISTRRPETLDLQNKGVECYFDNKRLVSSVHVIILCILPSQIFCVAEEIKDSLSSSHIVISHFSCLSARRLSQMVQLSNVIRPVLQWSSENPDVMNYDHSLDVITALENKENILRTCPSTVPKTDVIVSTDYRLVETLIYAVVNMCSEHKLSQKQTLAVVHAAVFGDSTKRPITADRLVPEHFGITDSLENNNRCFHFYNLVDVFENGSCLSKVLLENESLQRAFTSRYCHVFEDYLHKKKYGHL